MDAAVHPHQRGVAPAAPLVDGAGDQILAGAALARDQDRRIRVRHQLDLLQHGLQRLAYSHDPADPGRLAGQPRGETTRHGPAHRREQVVVVVRLREEVEDPGLHGAHRCGDVPVGRQEHGRSIHPGSGHLLVEVEARHAWKGEVHDHAGRRLLPRAAEKALRGFERADVEAFLP